MKRWLHKLAALLATITAEDLGMTAWDHWEELPPDLRW
jgi:hypothetical protein